MATHGSALLLLPAFLTLLLTIPSSLAHPAGVKASYFLADRGFLASSIDANLFTHLFCAFASLNSVSHEIFITSSMATFTSTVKQSNPSIKTLLSLGGGNSNASDFAAMASSAASRSSFIQSTISTARANGFSGLDLDWEYPQTEEDMANFGTLVTEWRAAVMQEAKDTRRRPLLLTAAVYFNQTIGWPQVRGYPVSAMAASLDWVNLMNYDYHAPSNHPSSTAAHAALFDPTDPINTDSGIRSWVRSGLEPCQLTLGLPYYGYIWTLADPNQHDLGAPALEVSLPDGAENANPTPTYTEIRDFIQVTGAPVDYDRARVVNYCYSGSTWIVYDDIESIRTKVSYAKHKGLLGYFSWSVAGDRAWTLSHAASRAWERH